MPVEPSPDAGRVADEVVLFAGRGVLVEQPQGDGPIVDSGRGRLMQLDQPELIDDDRCAAVQLAHHGSSRGRGSRAQVRIASYLRPARGANEPVVPFGALGKKGSERSDCRWAPASSASRPRPS